MAFHVFVKKLSVLLLLGGLLIMTSSSGNHPNKIASNRLTYLRFDFTITNVTEKGMVVNAQLINTGKDTVYFLTESCLGDLYFFEYDTAQFSAVPKILCNTSWPLMHKIPPASVYSFESAFQRKVSSKKIKLGFDFYKVDRDFPVKNMNPGSVHRPNNEKTILWAEEKDIE